MGRGGKIAQMFRCMMAAGMAVGLLGCATSDQAEEEVDPKTRPVLVGRVASLPKGQDFVLLQSYGAWSVPPGVAVYCVGPAGRLANLLPTGEKMGQFLAADLRDGEVQVGDAVYYRPDGEKPTAPGGSAGASGGEMAPRPPPEPANDAPLGVIEPALPE